MNLTTLTAMAAQFATDPAQTRYTGLYTQAINLGQQQFVLDSKCLFKDSSISVVGGTAAYSLPTDFMWEQGVTYKNLLLNPRSLVTVAQNRATDWTLDTGEPTEYIINPEEAVKTIKFHPYPPSGDAGGTAILRYYAFPADLSAGSDVPLNNYALLAQFHIGIAAWAAWFLMQSEPATPENVVDKKDLLSIYNDSVTKALDTFKNTASEPMRQRGVRIYG